MTREPSDNEGHVDEIVEARCQAGEGR